MRLFAGVTCSVFIAKTVNGATSALVEVLLAAKNSSMTEGKSGTLKVADDIETITFSGTPKALRHLARELLTMADEADAFFESIKSGAAFVSPEPTEEKPK